MCEFGTWTRSRYFSSLSGFIAVAFALALVTRGKVIWDRVFPINDGGFWLVFSKALSENHFNLPIKLSFNGSDFPLTYPPLAAYCISLVHWLTGIDETNLLLWLPAILSVFSVLAFAYFANAVLESRTEIRAAIVIFPLVPVGYRWFVMGGGVARTLGLIFFLLSLAVLARSRGRWAFILGAGCLAGLSCLSHPVAGLANALGIIAYVFAYSFPFSSFLLVGIGALISMAGWIWYILTYFGVTSFVQVLSTSPTGLTTLFDHIRLWTLTAGLNSAAVLMLLGFCDHIRRFKTFPFLLFLLMAIAAPTKVPGGMLAVPVVLIMARGASIIIDALMAQPKFARICPMAAVLCAVVLFTESSAYVSVMKSQSMTDAEYRELTELQSRNPEPLSLVVLSRHFVTGDAVGEWLVSLTHHQAPYLHQLREWSGDFMTRLKFQERIEECCQNKTPKSCESVVPSEVPTTYLLHKRSCPINFEHLANCRVQEGLDHFDIIDCHPKPPI